MQNVNEICTPIQLELCVAQYGLELYQGYINEIPHWEENVINFVHQRDQLEQQLKYQADPAILNSIQMLTSLINRYDYQLTGEYIDKLYDKVRRFEYKIALIQRNYDIRC